MLQKVTASSIAIFIFSIANIFCLSNLVNANQPVEVSGSVVTDLSFVTQGGIKQDNAFRSLGTLGYDIQFDSGLKFHVDGKVSAGDFGGDDSGDIQGYSNIDTSNFSSIYEFWFESSMRDGKTRLKYGQIDANSEFAFVAPAANFINSSMGFSPTIAFLPTYPEPTIGLVAQNIINKDLSFSLGVFSDDSNKFSEQFLIGEAQVDVSELKLKLGAWQYNGNVVNLNEQETSQATEYTSGSYITLQGTLAPRLFPAESTSWYFQWGRADENYVEIKSHVGAGIVWNALANDSDAAGLALTRIETSSFLSDVRAENETTWEIFYHYPINENVAIKPDLQYIISPAMQADIDNALVLTLRLELSF